MKATGATPADQARSLGLVVGDTIEGREHDHTARLQLLWIGEDVAVWRYWSKLDCGRRDRERVELPATLDAGGVTVCQRACRCGPDMCADSVACPRHNRNDG